MTRMLFHHAGTRMVSKLEIWSNFTQQIHTLTGSGLFFWLVGWFGLGWVVFLFLVACFALDLLSFILIHSSIY